MPGNAERTKARREIVPVMLALAGRDGLELTDLDLARERGGLFGIEAAGTGLERGGGSGADGLAKSLFERAAGSARGQESGQQHVAGANRRHGLDASDRGCLLYTSPS